CVALLVHVALLFVDLPRSAPPEPPAQPTGPIILRPPIPPPPISEPPVVVRTETDRLLPVPDPDPDDLEPFREEAPTVVPNWSDLDVELDPIVNPVAPPQRGPTQILPGVSPPRLIPESRVQPIYPELARVTRVEGNVILQAVVRSDGTVGEIRVLRCNRPNLGFEEAAIEAVRQWRYEPARQHGRPVDVYFTVYVEFRLR
ncbi:MAG: energy transducer TonB, partial [Planctomycetota bacterium]